MSASEPTGHAYRVMIDGASEEFLAPDLAAAVELAEEWARDGAWDPLRTEWVRVHVERADDPDECEDIDVRIDPTPPECDGGRSHDWAELSGVAPSGLERSCDRCRRCGLRREGYPRYQRPDTGEIESDVTMYGSGDDE